MPDPAKYKNKDKFMKDCIHQTLHVEKKDRDQGIAQCLNMWRQKSKKVANMFLNAKTEAEKKMWVVKIPYEGTAYIPIERAEKPKDLWDEEISSKLHTNYIDEGMPRFFRNRGEIEEETSERVFDTYKTRAKKVFDRRSAMVSQLDEIASDLEAQGEPVLAYAVDKVSDFLEAKKFDN